MSSVRRTVYLPGDEPAALLTVNTDEPAEESGRHWVYDSRESLVCVGAPRSDRKIGVLASRPFHHHGLNASYVDVSRETVSVNTATFGNCYPAEEADEKIRSAVESTVADLDRVITELTEHRDRLTAGLKAVSL